jgi:hypothetical protein
LPNTIGGSLDLDNLADRVIKPLLFEKGLKWKGWQAYRRGLATNLHELGVDDKTIQAILRHEDVNVTRSCYTQTPAAQVNEGMARLERRLTERKPTPRVAHVWQMPLSSVVN